MGAEDRVTRRVLPVKKQNPYFRTEPFPVENLMTGIGQSRPMADSRL